MRNLLLTLLLAIPITGASAQPSSPASSLLTPAQVAARFTPAVKSVLGITLPIFRVYKYSDTSGVYYAVLTESQDSRDAEGELLNKQIKALVFKNSPQGLVKAWELNDRILQNEQEEETIWFWTKYAEFKDYDQDGLIEPIIVYGTSGLNGYDDGRLKFLIYYKGQKVALRHQNSVLDYGRSTQVDKAFYALPAGLQAAVRQKMEALDAAGLAIFPSGWQTSMKNKKMVYDD
ncbi:M949_RS01915 family surface polysaccharide biosynthesis protein [Hymenobacter metallicola]|uniref:Uncharacterized protein n=1 Tax=Hymenobacter metallicola TaxID=2563114 RepID=A0A4Z0QE75_9BACT|nr:hypothetical protein [Hymenobacter metallicola]TGE28360.1 hypothetical protein E5K02_02520 [Hymenobacter metallicola]